MRFMSKLVGLEEWKKRNKETYPIKVPLLTGFDVVPFPLWGAAVWDCGKQQWIRAMFADGQELNLENCEVEIHEDGIEIISWGRWPEEE